MATKIEKQIRLIFRCSECDKNHDTKAEALSCCNSICDEVWLCDICYQEYLTEAEAFACGDNWSCDECGAGWDTESKADNCC